MKKLTLILILGSVFLGCVKPAEDSIRLIPKDYQGPIMIVFNQSNGVPKEYENGKRLYRIPKNGVLKTQFEPNYGFQNHQFFYVDSSNNREKIPFVVVQNQDSLNKVKDKTKIYAFGESAISNGEGFNPKRGKFTTPNIREFYIGNLLDIEKAFHDKTWFSNKNIEKFRLYEKK